MPPVSLRGNSESEKSLFCSCSRSTGRSLSSFRTQTVAAVLAGIFMAKLPELSIALADEKAETILSTGADTVVGLRPWLSDEHQRRDADDGTAA